MMDKEINLLQYRKKLLQINAGKMDVCEVRERMEAQNR